MNEARNETKRNETRRDETRRDETRRDETRRDERGRYFLHTWISFLVDFYRWRPLCGRLHFSLPFIMFVTVYTREYMHIYMYICTHFWILYTPYAVVGGCVRNPRTCRPACVSLVFLFHLFSYAVLFSKLPPSYRIVLELIFSLSSLFCFSSPFRLSLRFFSYSFSFSLYA